MRMDDCRGHNFRFGFLTVLTGNRWNTFLAVYLFQELGLCLELTPVCYIFTIIIVSLLTELMNQIMDKNII